MLQKEIINSINQKIRNYCTAVKTSTVKQHVMFLKGIGDEFKAIKNSEFDVSILFTMELVLNSIEDDLEDDRHQGKVDDTLLKALEELIKLNAAMLRGAKKDKDDSEDWIGRLRTYIKILRNLSIAALLIASNETTIKKSNSPESQMKVLFDWSVIHP